MHTLKLAEWPALCPNWLFAVQRYSSSLHKEKDSLPIIKNNIKDTRHFIPKPKWHAVTSTSLSHYKLTLDELLCKLDIPADVLSCSNLLCELALLVHYMNT